MDWFARWARDTPEAPFLIAGGRIVTFAAAHDRLCELSGGLRSSFGVGSRLGVVMRPETETVLTALAVPQAGMVLVPLPAASSVDERAELAGIARVDAVVAPGEIPPSDHRPAAPEPEAIHSIVFTSGSEGVPRPIRLLWQNLEASAAASQAHLDHRSSDRWLAVLPLHHVGGLSILLRSAREGSAAVLAGRFDARGVARLLRSGDVTLASFVSVMVERLADAGLDRGAPVFRHALVGGGPVSVRAMHEAPIPVLPTYGMTETASQVATADPADPRPDRLVVLDGAEIGIAPDGRILVDGPMVSPGALDQPDREGPLRTGDHGLMHGSRLEVLGRADSVILTGGENVMAARVESIVRALPGAGSVAVVGVPDDRWGELVALAWTGPADEGTLREAAAAALAAHEVPRLWRRVARLPARGIGKVDRDSVRALFG